MRISDWSSDVCSSDLLERLGLGRAVDLAFHLPTSWIDRKRVTELDMADAGRVISIEPTPVDYKTSGSARAPFRIHSTDAQGNYVSLVFFGRNSGWARTLLPLHDKRFFSGKQTGEASVRETVCQ